MASAIERVLHSPVSTSVLAPLAIVRHGYDESVVYTNSRLQPSEVIKTIEGAYSLRFTSID